MRLATEWINMDLQDYIYYRKKSEEGFTDKKFAEMLGITQEFLSRIKHYRSSPSIELAQKIEEITGGQVSGWELLKQYDKKQREKNG